MDKLRDENKRIMEENLRLVESLDSVGGIEARFADAQEQLIDLRSSLSEYQKESGEKEEKIQV